MNYKKCMKHFNCKICSDYNYCKDEINNNKRKKKNIKGRKKNERRESTKTFY